MLEPATASSGLKASNLTVRFGGLVAVDNVSLEAPTGPNGAGKSTTFNACSGLLRPTAGTVHLNGTDLTHQSPQARARYGLGRTFQKMELFDSLTVLDNVAFGREGAYADTRPWRHLLSTRAEREQVAASAAGSLELRGIHHLADRRPAELSTGQRRLVELARVAAGNFCVLLLDEPSSGLDHEETARFGVVLLTLVAERNIGLLLVEHDMELVMRVCDYLYVLDFSRPIFDGTPKEVLASPVVRAAYLGSESDELGAVS